ncbi:hypothetical protein SASPL_140877 [Salvia splendens]|uniref:Endoglucanase n=1 Tax=Salvia splendens TaxID=180675 RepID=A0A8X8WR82_SALSN|nr:hypothetical protein SASPL_140877 [Salvia splendens]
MSVYSDYLASASTSLACPNGPVSPSQLLALAKSQVDYILGDNPRATSYMVGDGKNYPQQVHHRASSIVSHRVDPSFVSCRGGYASWFSRKASDPNILTGAVVGGPDAYDNFVDQRDNYEQTEPATYNTAPLVGALTRWSQRLQSAAFGRAARDEESKPANRGQGLIFVEQKVTNSWIAEGKNFYRYSAIVSNRSSKKLKNLKLRILNIHGPLWGLTKSGDDYFFPKWMEVFGAGKTMEFVYIQPASPAQVLVSSYTLV